MSSTPKLRPVQQEALDWYRKANSKYVLLNLPTGSGKTLLATLLGDCPRFVLTETKALQHQYVSDELTADACGTYFGKSSIENECRCGSNAAYQRRGVDEEAPKRSIQHADDCAYVAAREAALSSPCTVLNYALYTATAPFAGDNIPGWGGKRTIVVDEAHLFIRHLENLNALAVRPSSLDMDDAEFKRRFSSDPESAIHALVDRLMKQEAAYSRLGAKEKGVKVTERLDRILGNMSNLQIPYYVFDDDKNEVAVKELDVHATFRRLIGGTFDQVIFMSATIGDPDFFTKRLGITDYDIFFGDPEWNATLSPIYDFSEGCCLNAGNWDTLYPEIASLIAECMSSLHAGEKGLVLCSSVFKSRQVAAILGDSLNVIVEANENGQAAAVERLRQAPGDTVLVSHYGWTGLDLPDELCRAVFVTKMPFLPVDTPLLKAMEKYYESDYRDRYVTNEVAVKVVQGCGRGHRHSEDSCSYYFLDGHLMKPWGPGRVIAEYLGNRMAEPESGAQERSGIESVEDEQCLDYA